MPAQASGGIDGVYRAGPDGARGNSACGTTVFRYPIRVSQGMVTMQTVAAGQLEGTVAPDGSVSIAQGRVSLTGQFGGGAFNGAYTNGRCSFAMTYKK